MLNLLTIGILSSALTISAVGQELKSDSTHDTSSSPAQLSRSDSAPRIDESLLPLSLASPYRDSLDLMFTSPEESSQFSSWMSLPGVGNRVSLSSELLLGVPAPTVQKWREFPFQSDLWMLESRANLLAPLRLELKSREKYRIWRTILGSVQVGGMAYLMYLHFKNYGLR